MSLFRRRKPVQDRLGEVVIDRLRENMDLYGFEKPWQLKSWHAEVDYEGGGTRLVVEFRL